MSIDENEKKARDIIQSFLKAKKILRMYPKNNPIYLNTLEDVFGRFKDFFYYRDDLVLHIKQNEILYDGAQVYTSTEKDENLALFFFKDGFREITFKKGLSYDELEEFLKITSLDYNREVLDDDVVTLFWEKDFQNIQYVVDETVLIDDDEYEARATNELEEKETKDEDLQRMYEDAMREVDDVKDASIVPLADKDLQQLVTELEKDAHDKTPKLFEILFEMFFFSETKEGYEDLTEFFMSAIEYAISRADIPLVTSVLSRLKQMSEDRKYSEDVRKYSKKILLIASGETVINLLGEILDGGQEIEENIFEEYVKYLDKSAIEPFMNILGELKSIQARKSVIEALIHLGTKDIVPLSRGLNDSRWYVVRNIIYILRKIGDKRAVDYLLKTIRHGDIRVKKEVIRALGELGGGGVLQPLRECLDDPDIQVRTAALRSFGIIGSDAAKRIVLNKIGEKSFKDKEFEEKKEFFEVLAKWKDQEVFNFLMNTVRKKVFFGRSKNFENRACAAHGLGLLGNKEALTALSKYKSDGNKLLREFSLAAVKRLEHG